MAILKCKMCGGDLVLNSDSTVAECEFCGTQQTVPTADNEKKITLFQRANRLRFACEFDKAAGIYESIVAEFPEEAEAYWGLVLCKYGIEYVDDPATAKKIPTCHRSSFDSVMDDSNFDLVMEYADAIARGVYRDEAKQIEELRKSIIEVSSKEEPYDIFICYKETALDGDRTIDSVIAQDVYDALTEKGYRVFFSRITLEDKLGQEYEPYIFAALNSAKIMLAFGTDYEYYNAVWVKNEWSRFLQLIAKGEKKTLIPCYKNIDAYDMPKEFAKLQAQDMGKVGAVQDLLRGIAKILPKNNSVQTTKETVVVQQSASNATVDSLLKRAFMFLEDEKWESADEYCEKVLDIDPECANAYLGKLLAQVEITDLNNLWTAENPFDNSENYKKCIRFADETLKASLANMVKERVYQDALENMRIGGALLLNRAAKNFDGLGDYKDSKSLKEECLTLADEAEKTRTEQINNHLSHLESLRKRYKPIYGMFSETIGVRADGTVESPNAVGYQKLKTWDNVVSVCYCDGIGVAIKSDGTLYSDGGCLINNKYKAVNLSDWKDIVQVSVCPDTLGTKYVAGLKSDGSVIIDKSSEYTDVTGWLDVVLVKAVDSITVIGLTKNGKLISTSKTVNSYLESSCDIVDFDANENFIVGLKKDGTIKVYQERLRTDSFRSAEREWKDIIAVRVGGYHLLGVKTDGTVVAMMSKNDRDCDEGQCNVGEWKDIVAIYAGYNYSVGIKSDGTVVAAGDYNSELLNYRLFNNIDAIEQERIDGNKKVAALKEERRKKGVCQHCGGTFKGVFTKKCVNCGNSKDY